ncbi:MAG: hypothetical protein H0W88_03425 [Parachlamydiaceae bacterium]|nr:hypothetical protein [Parachlamydiaceae bacterium]
MNVKQELVVVAVEAAAEVEVVAAVAAEQAVDVAAEVQWAEDRIVVAIQ